MERILQLLLALVIGLEAFSAVAGPEPTNSATLNTNSTPSKFIDPADKGFDAGKFLDKSFGFVPIVVPITEPAVGYGGAVGLVFINRNGTNSAGMPISPDMASVGVALTDNGTRAVFGGYSSWWLDGRLQTKIGGGYGEANLKFYGLGAGPLNGQSVNYQLTPAAGTLEARYRLGETPWMAGLGYAYSKTHVSFDYGGRLPPDVDLPSFNPRVAGLKPVVSYDTRNNIFTPTTGIYAEITGGVYSTALGGDSDFQSFNPVFIYYLPVTSKLTLGLNLSGGFSFGSAPFYERPFISLRGVPAFEYLADDVSQLESELRWQFWGRLSLVGFGGVGTAWNHFEHLTEKRSLTTGGVGFRYELARKFGLHMGVDVAFGPDGPVYYLQFGSAWFRP